MRRWLPRSLWLFTWSIWVWLGFGLYRELPRDLGPVLCHFPAASLSFRLSAKFLGESHEIYTHESRGKDKPSMIRIWDGETGDLLRTFEHGPISETIDRDAMLDGFAFPFDPPFDDCWLCERQSLLVASRRPELTGRKVHLGLSVLDLRTGEWLDLPKEVNWEPRFHDDKPWAVFSTRECEYVVDLRTSAILFRRTNIRPDFRWDPTPSAFFIGTDLIGVPLSRPKEVDGRGEGQEYELWTIPPASKPTSVFPDLPQSAMHNISATGRIAWLTGHPDRVVVFDVIERRTVFADPPNRTPDAGEPKGRSIRGEVRSPVLSRDGRRVFDMGTVQIWDVDSGQLLWAMHDPLSTWLVSAEMKVRSVDPDGRFEVHEQWNFFNAKGTKRSTYAVRSFDAGQLLYRCWEPTVKPDARVSSDGALIFDHDVVRLLPSVANYQLFAVCQAILALPLILLWAILRWRRKHNLRLESVTP